MNSDVRSELRLRSPAELGLRKDFALGDRDAVALFLQDWSRFELRHLRIVLPSPAWRLGADRTWYTWLLSRLANTAHLCVTLAPDSSQSSTTSNGAELSVSVTQLLAQYSALVDTIELPALAWEHRLGPAWPDLCHRLADATRAAGKRFVLSSAHWHEFGFAMRCVENGTLPSADALGIEMETGSPQHHAVAPSDRLREVAQTLHELRIPLPVWFSRVAVHASAPRPFTDVEAIQNALTSGAERTYWDAPDAVMAQSTGDLSLARRLLAARPDADLRRVVTLCRSPRNRIHPGPHALITGGAGFVGSNLADRLLSQGERVTIYDNLSRTGTERNVHWLKSRHGERLTLCLGDIRDAASVANAVERATHVFHFAGQVAVTSSMVDPLHDGEVNQRGTLVLLEALRNLPAPPPLIFTSTNKVYGALNDVALQVTASRYEPISPAIRNGGIDESRPLQFCSPYGCSKGAADQYVLDYAKSFGLPTMCLRMSCIYGRRQFGNEDQGWVAHFLKQAVTAEPIVIYGDGLQVRDVLFADDLVEAFLLARANMAALQGRVFNIGGGPNNVLSLVELLAIIEQLDGHAPRVSYRGWRPSDQRYYVSDLRKFSAATGWRPRVCVADGVQRLYDWMVEEFGERITQPRGQVAL